MQPPVRTPRRNRRFLPSPWTNRIRTFNYLRDDFERQKALAYKRIDNDGFGYWTVFTAGAGFLTGSYDIFAVNMIMPMLAIVYWQGDIPQKEELSINIATLIGTLIGQVTFGILGDRLGRKKMYGVLLIIMIIATVGLALCSKGAEGSVNILAWIISWRLLMGFAIGGDYPLSSVITAEFAPRKHRARMLASVFYAQPLGQLLAIIVAAIATACYRHSALKDASPFDCKDECLHATDKIWRWIVGIGAIPPSFAVLFRFYIPESPRYLLEVENDPLGIDAANYLRRQSTIPSLQDVENRGSVDSLEITDGTAAVPRQPNGNNAGVEMVEIPSPTGSIAGPPIRPPVAPHQPKKESWKQFWHGFSVYLFDTHPWSWKRFLCALRFKDDHFFDGNWTDLAGTALTWCLLDFSFYFLTVNSPKLVSRIWASPEYSAVYSMLIQYSWRALISTSIGAVLGGAIFIAMARFRYYIQIYGFLILAALFVAVGTTFITLLGGKYFAAIIVLYCLCNMFFDLGPNTSTFVIPAEVFPTRYRCTCHGLSAAAGKAGSIIAQIFLAKAKFGHPPIDVNDPHSTWLGWALLVNVVVMLFGAYITKIWVPNPCDIDGRSRSLEELGRGKEARKQMEEEERDARRRSRARRNE